MVRRLWHVLGLAALATLLPCTGALGASDPNQGWIEVRSPHFVVSSNAGEKEGGLFHTAFPNLRVDPAEPLLILAAKNTNTMMLLRCEARRWLQGVNRVLKALEIEVVRRQFLYSIYRMHISIYLRRDPKYSFLAALK
jgi:hypothetical protein